MPMLPRRYPESEGARACARAGEDVEMRWDGAWRRD